MYGLEAPSQYLVILKLKYPYLLLVVNYDVALVAWVHLASVTCTYAPPYSLSSHAFFTIFFVILCKWLLFNQEQVANIL